MQRLRFQSKTRTPGEDTFLSTCYFFYAAARNKGAPYCRWSAFRLSVLTKPDFSLTSPRPNTSVLLSFHRSKKHAQKGGLCLLPCSHPFAEQHDANSDLARADHDSRPAQHARQATQYFRRQTIAPYWAVYRPRQDEDGVRVDERN